MYWRLASFEVASEAFAEAEERWSLLDCSQRTVAQNGAPSERQTIQDRGELYSLLDKHAAVTSSNDSGVRGSKTKQGTSFSQQRIDNYKLAYGVWGEERRREQCAIAGLCARCDREDRARAAYPVDLTKIRHSCGVR